MAKSLGQIIRLARKRKGISLRDCAARAGIDFTSLAKLENGQRQRFRQDQRRHGQLRALAAALGISQLRLAAALAREQDLDDAARRVDDLAEAEEGCSHDGNSDEPCTPGQFDD